jgi:hypothetical protein
MRFAAVYGTVADLKGRVAGRVYPTAVNLDLRRLKSLPGGNTLIEDLRRLDIRLALCCKGGLRAVVSLFSL